MNFKGMRYPKEVIMFCVVFYLKNTLSSRAMEEFCKFRNFQIDHSTINRWVIKFSALLEKNYRKQKRKF